MNAALTYEDIIFSSKNKAYGAYILRKNYKRNVVLSVVITIIVFTLSVAAPLFIKHGEASTDTRIKNIPVILLPPTDIPIDKHPDIVIPATNVKSTLKFVVREVVRDEDASDENMPTITDLIDKLPSTQTVAGTKDGIEIITDNIPTIDIVKDKEVTKPFTWVEEMPRYSKGEDAWMEFFARNIIYPEIAKRAGVEGKVHLTFVVEKDGSTSDIEVLKGIGAGCDEEAIRALKLLDKWIPGRQNGNPVRVRISIPVIFRLN